MPTTLEELDVHEEDIEKMIPTLKANKGEPFGSFKKLAMDDAREIYRVGGGGLLFVRGRPCLYVSPETGRLRAAS